MIPARLRYFAHGLELGPVPTLPGFSACEPVGPASWELWLNPWETPAFDAAQLASLLEQLPAGIRQVFVPVWTPDGLCWHWSPRLQRPDPSAWQADQEAYCDDLRLQQVRWSGPPAASLCLRQFLAALEQHPPDARTLRQLLATPWTLGSSELEQLLCQAADRAIRSWNQPETAEVLSLGLGYFPDSPALRLLQSSFLSACGEYAACGEALNWLGRLPAEAPGSWPGALAEAGYLAHLQALLAYWRGKEDEARAALPAGLELPPEPAAADLLEQLQAAETRLALGDADAAQALLDPAIAAIGALPARLRAWSRQYVPELKETPELGGLVCHHLDFVTLERFFPNRLLSRLLYTRALTELNLGDNALGMLAQALANPMASFGKLKTVLSRFAILLASGPAGDCVELGCNQGATTLGLQTLLRYSRQTRELHVYDSFEGLPPPLPEDGLTPYVAGSCATLEEVFVTRFQAFGVPLPQIHPGWFAQTLPQALPEHIAFAYLDGDFYSSILESLEAIYPRLQPGAVVLIDDFGSELLEGVERACDAFFADKPERVETLFTHGVEAVGGFVKL